MDPLVPWLLLLIAGLVVTCAAMHSRLREVESSSNARQSLVADELRDAEAALAAALDRVRRMDQLLAERESRLCEPILRSQRAPAEASPGHDSAPIDRRPHDQVVPAASAGTAEMPAAGASADQEPQRHHSAPTPKQGPYSRRHSAAPADWRARAVEMAGYGLTSRQIAQELELPVGEVELVLALGS